MAGIYLHIPFCKKACHYCNFHFSTSLKLKDKLIDSLIKEMHLRADFFGHQPFLSSIYLGGGTPSLLSEKDLNRIFDALYELFNISDKAEITLEANPDDLSPAYLSVLAQSPVNRLSIGIQSFSDVDLQWMNRAHDAGEASRCIQYAQDAGFSNLSCDLIYGSPTTTDKQWQVNIQTLLDFNIPHISTYCLTVEAKTALDHLVKTGKSASPDDDAANRQFLYLMDTLTGNGYDHYEISNFARKGHYAVHNTSYWLGKPYLGLGPGAHSYRGDERTWNKPHNPNYVKFLEASVDDWLALKGLVFEAETLLPKDRYNEYVMTGLRTIWGCHWHTISQINTTYAEHFLKHIQPFLEMSWVIRQGDHFTLSNEGKLMADFISAELFILD